MSFEVPLEDGARIRMRRHGNPDGVRLLVTHGNGFAADAYYPYWRHLLSSFDVLVFDFRNHGQNVPVAPANHQYAQLSRDLERVVQDVKARLGPKKTAGIFHSMSARTAMKHAVEVGWRWDALMLFDPPDVPRQGTSALRGDGTVREQANRMGEGPPAEFQFRRRARRGIPGSRAPPESWVEGVHELMARSVLRKSPDGNGYELICAPENEATIYAQALILDLWPRRPSSAARSSSSAAIPISRARRRPARPTGRSASRAARLQLCRKHRPSPADREARRMHPADPGVPRQARAGVAARAAL